MAVYNEQTMFKLTLDTQIDLSGATVTHIRYEKPNGEKGVWIGTVIETTKIEYQIEEGDLDQVGIWRLQAVVERAGELGLGQIKQIQIDQRLWFNH